MFYALASICVLFIWSMLPPERCRPDVVALLLSSLIHVDLRVLCSSVNKLPFLCVLHVELTNHSLSKELPSHLLCACKRSSLVWRSSQRIPSRTMLTTTQVTIWMNAFLHNAHTNIGELLDTMYELALRELKDKKAAKKVLKVSTGSQFHPASHATGSCQDCCQAWAFIFEGTV